MMPKLPLGPIIVIALPWQPTANQQKGHIFVINVYVHYLPLYNSCGIVHCLHCVYIENMNANLPF